MYDDEREEIISPIINMPLFISGFSSLQSIPECECANTHETCRKHARDDNNCPHR